MSSAAVRMIAESKLVSGYGGKMCVLGDAGVGKTSIVQQFANGVFDNTTSTETPQEYKRQISGPFTAKCTLEIWDTAGQERYKAITRSYLKNARLVLLVYDATDTQSAKNIETWVEYTKKSTYCVLDERRIIVVGNKIDRLSPQDMANGTSTDAIQTALAYCKTHNIEHTVTSAKDETSVETLFRKVAKMIYDIRIEEESEQLKKETIENSPAAIASKKQPDQRVPGIYVLPSDSSSHTSIASSSGCSC